MIEPREPNGSEGVEPSPSPRPRGRVWIVSIVGLGCVLIFLLVTMLREPTPGTVLAETPPEVVGRWVTADPRYVGRELQIGAHDIALEVGQGMPPLRGSILVTTIREEDEESVLYMEYDVGEGPVIMEMVLDGPDRMYLRNQADVIWTRLR